MALDFLIRSAQLTGGVILGTGVIGSSVSRVQQESEKDDQMSTKVKPIGKHPLNPHYLESREQPTFLITSGEHYGSVINLDFDYVSYLGALESHDFNLTRTFSGTFRAPGTYTTPLDPVGKELPQLGHRFLGVEYRDD